MKEKEEISEGIEGIMESARAMSAAIELRLAAKYEKSKKRWIVHLANAIEWLAGKDEQDRKTFLEWGETIGGDRLINELQKRWKTEEKQSEP